MSEAILYDYWRSSASYRLRIALHMLGIAYETVPVDLLAGAHRDRDYLRINPQGAVPALILDGQTLTQSLSIIEYLAETRPDAAFLPADPLGRQRVRSLAYAIAMDIHPVCNLGVVAHVVELTGGGDVVKATWMRDFITRGLAAVETMLDDPRTGTFCHGDNPTMADLCLVPQVYNARRWNADISTCHRILDITARCETLPAFQAAHPDQAKVG
jgi:maleylacetoacetate isomerase